MDKYLKIAIPVVVIGSIAYLLLSKKLKEIMRWKKIPYHNGLMLDDAGTLYCKGEIKYTTEGIEYIKLEWEADVTFPGNGVAGWFEWGDIFGSIFFPGVMMPAPDGGLKWCNAEGEYHIWNGVLMMHPNTMEFDAYVDGLPIAHESTELIGFYDMQEGTHEVYSAFASEPICTDRSIFEMERYLETQKFKMIRQGNDFWFG